MRRRDGVLYRGWSDHRAEEVCKVIGIGPAEAIVRAAAERLQGNAAALTEPTTRWLMQRMTSGVVFGGPVASQLVSIVDLIGTGAPSHLDVVNHVYWEDPTLSSRMLRLLEST